MVGHAPVEMAKTVLEVADVAWKAVECCHHHHNPHDSSHAMAELIESEFDVIEALRSENERLRHMLRSNLEILQKLATSPGQLPDCPSDLHDRLLNAVNSESFLVDLEALRQKPVCTFPFDEPSGSDLEMVEIMINVGNEEPNSWVWVTNEKLPHNYEEKCGIDNENYLVLMEGHVVDGVANFMAKCVLANPKALNMPPVELQKALAKAISGMNKLEKMLNIWQAGKMLCTLSTWGLALASLYQGRAMLKIAVLGVHHSSKLALKLL